MTDPSNQPENDTVDSEARFSARVLRAMARWPDVPSVYHWLTLDRRGRWLMKGTPVTHPLLIDFINQHYLGDAAGRYYFQNGPQKVFVDLEGAPYILNFDAAQERLLVHTGQVVSRVHAASLLDDGGFALMCDLGAAEIDDRELVHLERFLRVPCGLDPVEALENLAAQPGTDTGMRFVFSGREVVVDYLARDAFGARFGFVSEPSPEQNETEYCD